MWLEGQTRGWEMHMRRKKKRVGRVVGNLGQKFQKLKLQREISVPACFRTYFSDFR